MLHLPILAGKCTQVCWWHIFIHKAEHTQQFLNHLRSLDTSIQFTTKSSDQQGSLPFLDTLTSQGSDGTFITTLHRKPTHTDQYLHWDSHHSITNKYNIYHTLSQRVQYVCSSQQLLKQENQHMQTALHRCNMLTRCSTGLHPNWISNSVKIMAKQHQHP